MTQILVTGMHRSGTTLCLDLVRRHRDVEAAINEGVLFDRVTGGLVGPPFPSNQLDASSPTPAARAGERTWAEFQHDPHDMTWIAKMSYPGPVILQEWCDSATRYIDCWLREFDDQARVIHLIRHPFAVFASARRRWSGDPVHLSNYGPITLEAICRDWANSVKAISAMIGDDNRVLTILYEDLVGQPENMLSRMLEHAKLDSGTDIIRQLVNEDVVFFGTIDASRARAFRDEPMEAISRSTSWLLSPWFEKWGYSDR